MQLARQAEQISADVPGWIAGLRSILSLTLVLTEAGDLAAAGRVCAAGLARSREAGDLWNQAGLLAQMATLDLRAGRIQDAAAHLREALQIAARTGDRFELPTAWTAAGTCAPRPGATPRPSRSGPRTPRSSGTRGTAFACGGAPPAGSRCAKPGRRSDPPGPARPRNAARR